MSTTPPPDKATSTRPPWLSFAVGAAIVVVVVVLFAVLRGGDDDAPANAGVTGASGATGTTDVVKPSAATPASLAALAASLDRPIYWIGPSAGRTYELSNYADGRVFVRYLDPGVAVGDARPDFLTVGSYAQSNPFKTVTDASKRAGAQVEKLPGGGLAVANKSRPTSWYIAYPDGEELIEVYSPMAGRARELVRSRRVVPVGS